MTLIIAIAAIALAGAIALWPRTAHAHCDTEDGPAVAAGAEALRAGVVEIALAWVRPEGEAEVRDAFDRAIRARSGDGGGRGGHSADRQFLEALVRVHRAGEGAGYEGIKPAGQLDPVIAAADRAVEAGAIEPLVGLVAPERLPELRARLDEALALRAHDVRDVAAGRRAVAAYVRFVRLAEGEGHAEGGEPTLAGAGHPHRAA